MAKWLTLIKRFDNMPDAKQYMDAMFLISKVERGVIDRYDLYDTSSMSDMVNMGNVYYCNLIDKGIYVFATFNARKYLKIMPKLQEIANKLDQHLGK